MAAAAAHPLHGAAAASESPLQALSPVWLGRPTAFRSAGRVYYDAFRLRGVTYTVGDCVYFNPPNPDEPKFVGRIEGAYEARARSAAAAARAAVAGAAGAGAAYVSHVLRRRRRRRR